MTESLVALRDRRQQVVARLSECYADDILEVEELERRLDLAHAARTVAELDQLVADLRPATSTALVPVGTLAIDDPNRAAEKKLRVIFGNVERRGPWSVPRRLVLRVVFGNAELDLREASLAAGETTIEVRVVFGNLQVILPPDLAIDIDMTSVLGNVEEKHRIPPQPDPTRPRLRFVGSVWFGNVETETRLPGESRKDARKREKKERKRQRRALEAGRD